MRKKFFLCLKKKVFQLTYFTKKIFSFTLIKAKKKKFFSNINFSCFRVSLNSIRALPSMVFENLNSLETLNIQNNKLTRIPSDVMDPVVDTLRVVDIMGKF